MKNWISILFIFLLTSVILISQTNRETPVSEKHRKKAEKSKIKKLVKSEIRSKDNPNGRADWERKRLIDPSTGDIPIGIRTREMEFAKLLPSYDLTSVEKSVLGKTTADIWSHRGPVNVGGRTRALAVDKSNASILLAGGVSGGMWKSSDGGTTWKKTTKPEAFHPVSSLIQDPRSGKTATWYYGTGELAGNSTSKTGAYYNGDGIFKSTDNGGTWTQISTTKSTSVTKFDSYLDFTWTLAIDPSNATGTEIYAATYGGIYRSADGFSTYTMTLQSNTAGNESYYSDVAATTTGVIYATLSSDGDNYGIFRSTDGISWTDITPASFPSTFKRVVIGIAPSNEKVVYFLAETPGSGLNGHSLWKYTYVSGTGTGSGGTWVNRSTNMPAFGGSVGNFDSQGSYDLVIKVKPDNENAVFIGGTNLYRSTDGFATKNNIAWIGGYSTDNDISQYKFHHPDQHSLAFNPNNAAELYSGHDGGISKTADCLAPTVQWLFKNNGYLTTQFYTVAFNEITANDNRLVGGLQDNGTWWTTTSAGATPWNTVFSGDGAFCAVANNNLSLYVSAQQGVMYRVRLSDEAFYNLKPTDAVEDYEFINPFVLDPTDSKIMYLFNGTTLWRNSNIDAIPFNGNYPTTNLNWTKLTSTTSAGYTLSAIAVCKTPANRVYYASHNGTANKLMKLEGANSGNPAPVSVRGSNFPSGGYISSIAVNPDNGNEIVVTFSNYGIFSVFHSANGGTSWTNISGNLEQKSDGTGDGPSVRSAAILPVSNGKLFFAGTSTGLYATATLNGMSTVWVQQGKSTIGNVVVEMVKSRQADGLVVAGTHGNGVYSAKYTSTTVNVLDEFKPNAVVLYDNFPNPFNPETVVRYYLPFSQQVKLEVYDLNGRLLDVADTGVKPEGVNEVRISGRNWASGTYLYRLTTESGKVLSKKMILIK